MKKDKAFPKICIACLYPKNEKKNDRGKLRNEQFLMWLRPSTIVRFMAFSFFLSLCVCSFTFKFMSSKCMLPLQLVHTYNALIWTHNRVHYGLFLIMNFTTWSRTWTLLHFWREFIIDFSRENSTRAAFARCSLIKDNEQFSGFCINPRSRKYFLINKGREGRDICCKFFRATCFTVCFHFSLLFIQAIFNIYDICFTI